MKRKLRSSDGNAGKDATEATGDVDVDNNNDYTNKIESDESVKKPFTFTQKSLKTLADWREWEQMQLKQLMESTGNSRFRARKQVDYKKPEAIDYSYQEIEKANQQAKEKYREEQKLKAKLRETQRKINQEALERSKNGKQPKHVYNTASRQSKARTNRRSRKSSTTSDDTSRKDDFCVICGHGGLIVVCDTCVQGYHITCLRTSLITSPADLPDHFTCEFVKRECTDREIPRLLEDEITDEQREHFVWLQRRKTSGRKAYAFNSGGRKYYTSFERADERYDVGTHVLIKRDFNNNAFQCGDDMNVEDYYGEIVDMYEDADDRWISVKWFASPEETRCGRLSTHHPHELFETIHINECSVSSIQCRISILSYAEYSLRESREELDEHVFFARARYNMDTGIFQPLLTDTDTETQEEFAEPDADDTSSSSTKKREGKKKCTIDDSHLSIYERAAEKLQLASLPPKLPCRETERLEIYSFITNALQSRSQHNSLYIAGVPGTGKSATVRQIINELRSEVSHSKLPAFTYIELNGMKLPDPTHIYGQLYHALTNRAVPASRALLMLEKHLNTQHATSATSKLNGAIPTPDKHTDSLYSPNKLTRSKKDSKKSGPVILLVDEIDYLLTKNQSVLYNLLDWPSRANSQLILLTISNTLDLPELLLPRVQSRLGMRRVHFLPYNMKQIQTIISQRLSDCGDLFESDAIELCARKVASVSGDVRRALAICKRAAELANEEEQAMLSKRTSASHPKSNGKQSTQIGMRLIDRAINELQSSTTIELLRRCTLYEKLLICSLVLSGRAEGREDFDIVRLSDRNMRLCTSKGISPVPTLFEVEQMCYRLHSVRIVDCEYKKFHRWPMVKLSLLAEDVKFAFANVDSVSSIL